MASKNKILIVLQGILWHFKSKNKFKKDKHKNILIILELPGIGDAVLQINVLYHLSRVMKDQSDYKLYIAGSKITCNFLENIKSTFDIELVEVDFSFENRSNFSIFKDNYLKLNSRYYCYIISFDNLSSYTKALIIGLEYGGIVFSEDQITKKYLSKDFILRLLLKNINLIKTNYSTQLLTHKLLVYKNILNFFLKCVNKDLFVNKYEEYKIPILVQRIKIEDNYCILSAGIAQGHDYPYRSWNIEKFAAVANFILENTDLTICLVGTKDDEVANSELYNMIKMKNRVIDLTTKTSFAEWVEVLRNAEFVFGNDSGYIHLASMLRTKSFVIAGFWNYGRFLPYSDDVEVCAKPIDIRTDKPKCALCNFIKHKCIEKVECDKKVIKDGIYKCIDDITAEMAIEAVKSYYIGQKG